MRRWQIKHCQRAGPEWLDFGEGVFLHIVANVTAGTDPDRAGILHDRQQRRRQSASHRLIGFGPRHAIGYDHETHRISS